MAVGGKSKMNLSELINDLHSTAESTEAKVDDIKKLLLGDSSDPNPSGLVHRVQLNTHWRIERLKSRGFWVAALVSWLTILSTGVVIIFIETMLSGPK